MTPTLPADISVVQGGSWSVIDFISDLHLQQSDTANFQSFQYYLRAHSPDALFILGDLFEVWVGDDFIDSTHGVFEKKCLDALKTASLRFPIYFLAGNRDFLLGQRALTAGGMQALSEPSVLKTKTTSILLSHGDYLCLDDQDYQKFRLEVRSHDWQSQFFVKPLQERIQIAKHLRQQSQQLKQKQTSYADVDQALATDWMNQLQCEVMVHGHTHKPQSHNLENKKVRHVLPDWDFEVTPHRGYVWRYAQGVFEPVVL
ncbi:MAG: UDP-2,3-diacylglucosamine diphosphatase [Limnohabitans sp.]|nr:UDP-2,3-diacylglucosamine diphosphatase [Limnohabitans sp.]